MDSSDAIHYLILLILLALSAMFSSAETSMTTFNKMRIRSLADTGDKRAKILLDLSENRKSKLLSAILIGNNIVNISASSLAATLAYSFGGYAVSIVLSLIHIYHQSSLLCIQLDRIKNSLVNNLSVKRTPDII